MPTVILDTDFLSSFLKIDRCDLIRSLFQVEEAFIPAAVFRELAQTDLLTQLLACSWIHVWPHEPPPDTGLLQDAQFEVLGAGEQACILLAKHAGDSVVLMSDNLARGYARSQGIGVVNIPAFLLACKTVGLIERRLMSDVVAELKAKDFYEFRADVRKMLLD